MKNFKKIILVWIFLLSIYLKQYVGSAKLTVPEFWEFVEDCPFPIEIQFDTEWTETTTIDVKILENETMEVIDFDWSKWDMWSYLWPKKSKARHPNFKNQPTSYILWTSNSKINWQWIFGTVRIKPLNNTKKVELNFYTIPNYNWDDSNISEIKSWTVIDKLNFVNSWIYKSVKWTCPEMIISNEKKIILQNLWIWNQDIKLIKEMSENIVPYNPEIKISTIPTTQSYKKETKIRQIINRIKKQIQKIF